MCNLWMMQGMTMMRTEPLLSRGAALAFTMVLGGCAAGGGIHLGVPVFHGVSIGIGVGSGGLSGGLSVGSGPVGAGVSVGSHGQVSAGAGIGVGVGAGPMGAGIGTGVGTVLYDPAQRHARPAAAPPADWTPVTRPVRP